MVGWWIEDVSTWHDTRTHNMTVRSRRVYECTCVRTVGQYQPEESCVREPQNHVKWAYDEDVDDDSDRQDDDDRLEEVKSMMIDQRR